MLKDFRDFIARGNVIDLAVAVILGVAFGAVVTSMVNDVLMPPIGKLAGNLDFKDLYIPLGTIPDEIRAKSADGVVSLTAAKAAGVPVIAYGAFINTVINFIIVSFCIFILVKGVKKLQKMPPSAVTTKDCPLCLSAVPLKATKCAFCTSAIS